MAIYSTGNYGDIYFIGTIHSNTTPEEITDEIDKLSIRPEILCVEAPDGIYPQNIPEHKAAVEYINNNKSVLIKEIDKRRGDYIPDKKPVSENIDHISDPDQFETKSGVIESTNPTTFEHNRERNQMMALEIKEYNNSYNKIVVIVGGRHVEGIISELETLDTKYNDIM